MKVLIAIGALVALLTPIQCAGVLDDMGGSGPLNYESSGYLTADWTQKACAAAGGTIDLKLKGNQKCCNVTDSRVRDFSLSCSGEKDRKYRFVNWSC
ncbi:hypothetical protein PHMEG_00012272 [Phytophthora megakarya]|uniref:Uncharacterized protein n=1 Tax=Phytophthora megakarya TaxID=4795 RepID=A0A225W969_9STRA|nr:hypothetical protein PHMEG_00012272 [Phytophthora megakarya]